jgi:replication fork protection complex subunit Tof1/Swi1
LRITDSDDEDDEERDREFFALEEQRRKKISGVIRNALLTNVGDESGSISKKGKRKARATKEKAMNGKKKRRKTIAEDDDESAVNSEVDADEDMGDLGAIDLVSDAEDTPDTHGHCVTVEQRGSDCGR